MWHVDGPRQGQGSTAFGELGILQGPSLTMSQYFHHFIGARISQAWKLSNFPCVSVTCLFAVTKCLTKEGKVYFGSRFDCVVHHGGEGWQQVWEAAGCWLQFISQ